MEDTINKSQINNEDSFDNRLLGNGNGNESDLLDISKIKTTRMGTAGNQQENDNSVDNKTLNPLSLLTNAKKGKKEFLNSAINHNPIYQRMYLGLSSKIDN